MSIRYTIDNLKKMREAAGLGVLSMGVCAISGELVSSTPIPGSRCGHAGQNPAEYGGYLLGEGMTPVAALYLANLHNHFPALVEAAEKVVDEWDQDAVAYLGRVSLLARSHGWAPIDGSLADWIGEHLATKPVQIVFNDSEAMRQVVARAEAAEAELSQTRQAEKWLQAQLADAEPALRHQVAELEAQVVNLARELDAARAAVSLQADATVEAVLSGFTPRHNGIRDGSGRCAPDCALCAHDATTTLAERERIIDLLAVNTSFPVVVCEFDKHAEEMVGDILSHEDLRAALAVKP